MTQFALPTVNPETGEYDPREFVFPDPYPLGALIFLVIVQAVSFCLLIFVIVRVIRHRNERLIRVRNLATMIPTHVMSVINLIVFGISIMLGKQQFCYIQDALNLASPVLGMHYNFFIPIMVFQSDLNTAKLERAHSGKKTNVVRWLQWCTLPYRVTYTVFIACVAAGIYLLFQFYGDLQGDCNREAQLTVSILVLVIIVSIGYFLVKLSKVQDPFYLKFESNVGSFFNLPLLFMMLTYPIFPQIYGDWFDYRWVFIFSPMANLYVNGLFTALLTYDWFILRLEKLKGTIIPEDQIKEADTLGNIFALSQGMDLFQAVLSHPAMLEGFTQFALKEWSVENVLFYKGVEEFKELWTQDPKQAQVFASMLVREYITMGAPLEVNLDHVVRKNIMKEVSEEGLSQSTFDHAQKCIYDLMKKDSFEKWRKTANFRETIQKLVNGRRSNLSDTRSSDHDSSRKSGSQHTEMRTRIQEVLNE